MSLSSFLSKTMGNVVVKTSSPVNKIAKEIYRSKEERIEPVKEYTVENTPEEEYTLEDISSDACEIKSSNAGREIEIYCKHLVCCNFRGQTNLDDEQSTDHCQIKTKLNLGFYLKLLDRVIRETEPVNFTGDDEEYTQLINMVAVRRKRKGETTKECFERLQRENERFVKVYRARGKKSEKMNTKKYWGTRQQLLAGKVIADWVDVEGGPLDPIFGVLLQPNAGRVGPGDTGLIHKALFDQTGHMAYHSAAHDGFGYLYITHSVGPGYDYLDREVLDNGNCMAGQFTGIEFWVKVLKERDVTINLPGLENAAKIMKL